MIKSCLLCKNIEHPCECSHCEGFDCFKISKEGKILADAIYSEGYNRGYAEGRIVRRS